MKAILGQFVKNILVEHFVEEVDVYEFERGDVIDELFLNQRITETKEKEMINGFGIPNPEFLAWIPILFSSFLIIERISNMGVKAKKELSLKELESNFKKEMIENGLDEEIAEEVAEKYIEKLYNSIMEKLYD